MSQPERTCIGCRGRGVKSELLRLVERAALVAVDLRQTESGRGAYLHRVPDCLDRAVRRRAAGRALRATLLDGGQLARVVEPHVGRGEISTNRHEEATA
jgi:predicted RNA-binding protein YlxR (DUF448 family)